ncbi:hypothetical protein [Oscillibacter sp.]|uniref:hypothetical protein n=1 Tax=Oscillibacter sp. TaxID=1945593 RepID=UPI00289EBE6E|nr:hypothetical protein [Oscillibacter sp.]
MKKRDDGLLALWEGRYRRDKSEYQKRLERMDRREELYRGSRTIKATNGGKADDATHVRNLVMELIETQVDSNIPQPKVTAVREKDEWLAKIIEDMIRNELNRLPMERLMDISERTCPIQGGEGFLAEWDVTQGTHTSIGEIRLTELHPKKIIPQHGVYSVEDMEWYFIDAEKTKGYVKRRYGVDLAEEAEENPELRNVGGDGAAEGLVTIHMANYRNEHGGIGRFVWAGDTPLEHLKDCQARRLKICKKCGAVGDGVKCRECGSASFEERVEEYETLTDDIVKSNGEIIPAESPALDEFGQPVMGAAEELLPMDVTGGILGQMPGGVNSVGVASGPIEMAPTKIPYYKPDRFPLIIRKNVSLYGEFLGHSDVDAIEDQQNATNKLSTKINKKVLGGGSVLTLPADLKLEVGDQDLMLARVTRPEQIEQIQTRNLQVDISADLALLGNVYEQARQTIGVTDSMQGRKDPTATSAVAKQFSAQQAAGRMESKRVMKQAMFQDLFQMIFQLKLAYADEPRPVVSYNDRGEREYREFNRWDFLELDDAGQPYWNDNFLFACDASAPLAGDREKLWQENRMNLQQGAYGPPNDLRSLILFWEVMEKEHYPMASLVKKNLQEQLEQQAAQTMVPGMDAGTGIAPSAADIMGGEMQ